MGMKRVIAFYMHENERDAAKAAISAPQATDSYVVGEIDETRIKDLQASGLIIQEIGGPPTSELSGPSPATAATAAGRDRSATPREADLARPQIYTIHIVGPLLEPWHNQLRKLGVRIIESVGPSLYAVHLQPAQVPLVRNLDFVSTVRVRAESETAPPIPASRAGSLPDPEILQVRTYDIRLKDPADANTVLEHLSQREVLVAGVRGRKIRVYLKDESPVLAELGIMPEVYQILEYVPPKLSNDRARILLGIDNEGSAVSTVIPFDGTGQVVGVADTGIDDQHPDLRGHVAGISALGRAHDHSDPDGHGTHVAGSICGDGTASTGTIKGTAPRAKLFFQSIMDARGELGGLPWDLNDLFNEAYQAGARIHNNSWGADTESQYTFNSIEADEFVASHRDMVIVIAAGNEGTARAPFKSKPGFVDWLSIGSPATSKNAVTVGACQTDRTTGGYSGQTWSQAWPGDFPVAPVATEKVSGNPESMAAFSSRGPCDDRRIKPDVVAPGTDIVSTKSSRAPLRNFWGSFPGHTGQYAYMGGTSMAAPIVSGCLALIRQYYVDVRGHEPSAALLKGTLINSTRRLTGASSTADFADLPNFHQGFGCVHMPWAIPNPSEPNLKLEFRDTWKDNARKFTAPGKRFRYVIKAGSGRALRFCLAYTDIPARALQNNVNLFVQFLPTGEKWVGNQNLPQQLTPVDGENNVEIIRIDAPTAGDYLIQIAATNLLGSDPQDFALVVTGDLQSAISDFL